MIAAIQTPDRVVRRTPRHKEKRRLHPRQIVTDNTLPAFLEAEILWPSADSIGPWHLMLLQDHRIWEQLPELRPFARMTDPPFTTILVCEDEELENSENLSDEDVDVTLRDALCEIGDLGLQATCIRLDSEEAQEFRRMLDIPRHVTPTTVVLVGKATECNELIDQLCEI